MTCSPASTSYTSSSSTRRPVFRRAQVLQAATIVPARVMHMDDSLGSLRPGKLADAIIVHGNPLESISQLRKVGTTIKGGVMYDTRALYATAGVTAPPA